MLREVLGPLVELRLQGGHLLQGQLVRGRGGIVLLEDLGKDSCATEQGQSRRQPCALTREAGLEALLGNVFVVRVRGILGVDIVILEQLW